MRFAGILVVGILAASTVLSACDVAPGSAATGTAKPGDTAGAASAGAFAYRYTFSLPASRIEAVQESHARGCDQLGPARCRITAMRYKAGTDTVLTLMLDPRLARAFGTAASGTVRSAHGALLDADIAGTDAGDASGSAGVVAQLREALDNAEAQRRTAQTPDQKAQATARADRVRAALATIGEIDRGASSATATTPVLFRYSASGGMPGIGASPAETFDTAGDTFLASLAGLLVVLASIGPWIVLLLGGALLLRWILARTEGAAAPVLPPAPREGSEANRNVVQRWFARDDAKEHEPT